MPLANPLEGGCICGKLRYHVSDLPLVVPRLPLQQLQAQERRRVLAFNADASEGFRKTLERNDYLRRTWWKRGNASAARVSELLDFEPIPNCWRIPRSSMYGRARAIHRPLSLP